MELCYHVGVVAGRRLLGGLEMNRTRTDTPLGIYPPEHKQKMAEKCEQCAKFREFCPPRGGIWTHPRDDDDDDDNHDDHDHDHDRDRDRDHDHDDSQRSRPRARFPPGACGPGEMEVFRSALSGSTLVLSRPAIRGGF